MSSTQQLLLGEGAGGAAPVYIEEVFSTYLYTGTGASLTITNGIDLSTKGGMVWIKDRSAARNHILYDTVRGATKQLSSNLTSAQSTNATGLTAFSSSGFSVGSSASFNSENFVSWTFREQPKFFDVVTYTGDGTQGRQIAHSLGSTPGCIFVKCTSTTSNWTVYHRSLTTNYILQLNSATSAINVGSPNAYVSAPTDTTFTVGNDSDVNASGATYVAYIFAHNAAGFGLSGTDNVISCGSYTGNGTSLQSINLGYEPQLVLIKSASIAGTEWAMLDNMRGVATGGVDAVLNPNTSGAEASPFDRVDFTSTGFNLKTSSSIYNETGTYIYIAIRRGPMKVPTSGTSVFSPKTWTGTGATANVTGIGFPSDLWIAHGRNLASQPIFNDRLRGAGQDLFPNQTTAETTQTSVTSFASMDGVTFGTDSGVNLSTYLYINYAMRRAPSFFDVVCYTGTSSARTVTHNLTVAPELMIFKARNTGSDNWFVYAAPLGPTKGLYLNQTNAAITSAGVVNNTAPTASVFTTSAAAFTNINTTTYVAYLFATCAGVSKVGSYTGTGTTKQIDCGFTGGARFVLIKRTDSTGDWYVWDSARGIVAGNDPYLLMNSTVAEVTNTDYIDTYSAGFEISSTAPAAINASGGTFIFLAIA